MSNQGDHFNLCKADADMLDRLVDVGFEIDQLEDLTKEEQLRASNILKMFGLLKQYPVEDASDTLIDVTLARIDQYESKHRASMHIQTVDVQATSSGFAFRMPDLISIACMVLIGASLVIWLGRGTRAQSMSYQCANNMAAVGMGLANFAFDNNGAVPTTSAVGLGSLFGGVTPDRMNPDALLGEYCSTHHLHCPGHEGTDGGGFSYQTQRKEIWDALKRHRRVFVVLSDTNPILDAILTGRTHNPLTPSQNHGGNGQNQLLDDGSTISLVGPPVLGGDKIWVPDRRPGRIDIFLTH
ncbi:MAG TPA: hypothetical protein QF528_04850 [Phycisphaerales bacterium]|nr:hypothetical protein [Phycisphaerales bacterium]|tara:strand:+ start:2751 stop:3641 length:891 start_codon:yes stop_codon:yes gene_type:complete